MPKALKYLFVNLLIVSNVKFASAVRDPFDLELYENVLDAAKCEEQLSYIRNNDTSIRIQFMDASFRIPRTMLKGNTRDLGSYFECLAISQQTPNNMFIEGKYCPVQIPVDQENFELPPFPGSTWPDLNITWPDLNITWPVNPVQPLLELPWREFDRRSSMFTEELKWKLNKYEQTRAVMQRLLGEHSQTTSPARIAEGSPLSGATFELALCIPKVCTPKQALNSFTLNVSSTLEVNEVFCRLPDDKPWVPADTVAVVILSIIGLVTIISSAYDIRHTVLLKRDPKKANKIFQSFSVYTNGKNFFIFPSGPNVVTCLDGIRSFAMIWVIVGHTFVTQLTFIAQNPLDIFNFMTQFSSLWITSGTITVDTFFTISGLLVVYTTAAKVSRRALVKNLHLFYLNRLLRMFPVLAFAVLWTASFLHRMADGPYFMNVGNFTRNCRQYWWSTLLYVQNFVNPANMCIPHSWYLAIDMQLHLFSPLVLFFVLGQSKRSAWLAMGTALVGFVAGSSIYNFINDFQSATVSLSPHTDGDFYLFNYYIHTLPRAAPFFVGMLFGYLLHLYREKKPKIPPVLAFLGWVLALTGTSAVCLATYWNIQPDWDNQLMDNILNSYKRPLWATCIGWIIFACHNGYGGPINWVLSLHVFKILGRLSYAMYILHYMMIFLINGTKIHTNYFAVHFSIHRFFIDFSLAVIAAFLVTLLIDFPFANLIKMAMGPPPKRPPPKEKPSLSKDVPEIESNPEDLVESEKRTRM